MKFLIDANLPASVVETFVAAGYDAIHVADLGIAAESDTAIAAAARMHGRAIVTRDFDFADVRLYVPRHYHGIVVLTMPHHRGTPYIRMLLEKLFAFLGKGAIEGKLLVVDADRIRVRD